MHTPLWTHICTHTQTHTHTKTDPCVIPAKPDSSWWMAFIIFSNNCFLLFSADRKKGSVPPFDFQWVGWGHWWGVWELAEALFIAMRFLTQAPKDEPNKSLYHYIREAGPSPGGPAECLGTFCSVTASSITTPNLPHQPPTPSALHPPTPTALFSYQPYSPLIFTRYQGILSVYSSDNVRWQNAKRENWSGNVFQSAWHFHKTNQRLNNNTV